jgi:hypothetical protein
MTTAKTAATSQPITATTKATATDPQPITPATTLLAARVARLTVTDTDCIAMLQPHSAAGYRFARLPTTHGNYNALYSLLLSSWINQTVVLATLSPGLTSTDEFHVALLAAEVGEYADSQYDAQVSR